MDPDYCGSESRVETNVQMVSWVPVWPASCSTRFSTTMMMKKIHLVIVLFCSSRGRSFPIGAFTKGLTNCIGVSSTNRLWWIWSQFWWHWSQCWLFYRNCDYLYKTNSEGRSSSHLEKWSDESRPNWGGGGGRGWSQYSIFIQYLEVGLYIIFWLVVLCIHLKILSTHAMPCKLQPGAFQ